MNPNVIAVVNGTKKFLVTLFTFYLLFYIILLSDYSLRYYITYIPTQFIGLINNLFVHKPYYGIPTADMFWAYFTSFVFLLLALVVSFVWLITDKKNRLTQLYDFTHVLSRYFLAFTLLYYGIEKLDGHQFGILPYRLVPSVGSYDAFNLYWMSTGTSKSYTFFGGLLETAAAVLLLFRRTSTPGALIALAVLLNVLFINIGYDVPIKLKTFHLILASILILLPNFKNLTRFLLLKQSTGLSPSPSLPLIGHKRFRWLRYGLKFLLISYMLFTIIKDEIDIRNNVANSPIPVVGLYHVRGFESGQQSDSIRGCDSLQFVKLAFNQFQEAIVKFTYDSTAEFVYDIDTVNRVVDMNSIIDTASKMKLNYQETENGQWLFDGTFGKDSIRFSCSKVDIHSLPLLKNRGRIKWKYD